MNDFHVFIDYSGSLRGFAADLAGVLKKEGYDVFWDGLLNIGDEWASKIKDGIKLADAIILILEGGEKGSNRIPISNYYPLIEKPIIPVVVGCGASIPLDSNSYKIIHINSINEFDYAAKHIKNDLLALKIGHQVKTNKAEKAAEQLNAGIDTHIQDVIDSLKKRKLWNKVISIILYGLSALILIAPLLLTLLLLPGNIDKFVELELKKLIVFGISYCLSLILMISLSKFLFTLAKSCMVESIRASDRIHAISFGKFYIKAFDENVTREEIIKVFETWNIDNGASSYRTQSTDDYDPKLLDKLLDLVNLAKRTQ